MNTTSIDMSMVPSDTSFNTILVELVKAGHVSMERLDKSARRVMALKKELGLLENGGLVPLTSGLVAKVGQQADIDAARDMARGNIVLLQNGPAKQSNSMCCRGKASASESDIQGSITWLVGGALASVPPQGADSTRVYFSKLANLYYQENPSDTSRCGFSGTAELYPCPYMVITALILDSTPFIGVASVGPPSSIHASLLSF